MSSNVEFKWYCGTAIIAQRPISKMVEIPARRQGKTQAIAMKLSEMMKRGLVKSAWGDEDTPDEVGLSQRDGTVEERLEAERQRKIEQGRERLRLAKEEADREAAREAERNRAAMEAAAAQMEQLEGFGSF